MLVSISRNLPSFDRCTFFCCVLCASFECGLRHTSCPLGVGLGGMIASSLMRSAVGKEQPQGKTKILASHMLLGNGVADHSNLIYTTCGVQQKLWPKPFILLEVACIDTDDQGSNLKFIHDKMGVPSSSPPKPGRKVRSHPEASWAEPFWSGLVWLDGLVD